MGSAKNGLPPQGICFWRVRWRLDDMACQSEAAKAVFADFDTAAQSASRVSAGHGIGFQILYI